MTETDDTKGLARLLQAYTLEQLLTFRSAFFAIPDTLLSSEALEILGRVLNANSSEVQRVIDAILEHLPQLLEKRSAPVNTVILCPPVVQCLRGCGYNIRTADIDGRLLTKHKNPVKVRIYDLKEEVVSALEYTYRCRGCGSRYSYSSYYDGTEKGHFLYGASRELLRANERVYWTASLSNLLVNSVLHSHCTFQAFAEIMHSTFGWDHQFSRKLTAEAYFTNEIENELRTRGIFFKFSGRKINCDAVKYHIDDLRKTELYYHDCGTRSNDYGCQYMDIMDGLWSFGHRHCAMPVKKTSALKHVNLPQVCENPPQKGSSYCRQHCIYLDQLKQNMSPEEFRTFLDQNELCTRLGADTFYSEMDGVQQQPCSDASCANKEVVAPWCRKKTGKKAKTNWSRGLLAYISSCGTVAYFAPLYRSESLSQVVEITLEFLYRRLQQLPKTEWPKYFLCYDNMCNFCRLKALKQPLSHIFPTEYCDMVDQINKIIDGLHLSNHRQKECHDLYNPDRFVAAHPEVVQRNTMAAEQAFSWLGRYKKQINSMNKVNQHFFIHRLIVRHNAYLARCIKNNKTPVVSSCRSRAERIGV